MACAVPIQFVLYDNDAVDVSYTDDSKLELLPCATSFIYHQGATPGQHPLFATPQVQQNTQFVISTFQPLVHEALDFRNRFAARPYLCAKALNPPEILKLHTDIFEVAWPSSLDGTALDRSPDGSTSLVSVDEYASVTLDSSHQSFSVRFLCKLSQPHSSPAHRRMPGTVSSGQALPDHTTNNPELKDTLDDLERHRQHIHTFLQSMDDPKDLGQVKQGQGHNSSHGPSQSIGHTGQRPVTTSTAQLLYCWVVQHHSILSYPAWWRHPLGILVQDAEVQKKEHLKSAQKQVHIAERDICIETEINDRLEMEKLRIEDQSESRSSTEEVCEDLSVTRLDPKSGYTYTDLPCSLPLTCAAPHLHRRNIKGNNKTGLTVAANQAQVKVICSQGVIYSLRPSPELCVEVYPGDGSVMRTSGHTAQFFRHHLRQHHHVEQLMYSVKNPPPEAANTKYSVEKLMKKAASFYQQMAAQNLSLHVTENLCCWKVLPSTPHVATATATQLLEECEVAGVGRFTAHSNGRVRVVFSDRTILEMYSDFSQRLQHSGIVADQTRGDIPPGFCRLLLRSGHYQVVPLDSPGQLQRYVSAALEWVSWVNTSPTDRARFYEGTVHDPECHSKVRAELSKISCFNYIIENTVLSQFRSGSARAELDKLQEPSSQYRPLVTAEDITRNKLNNRELCGNKGQFTKPVPWQPTVPMASGDNMNSACLNRGDGEMGYSDLTMPSSICAMDSALSLGTIPSFSPGGAGDGSFDLTSIHELLSRNSRAVEEIDSILKVHGETKPIRD